MDKHNKNKPIVSQQGFFEKFSNWATKFTGSSAAFIGAVAIVVIWAVSGPIFDYSETWQLVINTGTTIITFLMVFLIQKAQNKDSKAVHLKLNELIAAHEGASNRMVNLEDITEAELDQLHKFYEKLAKLALKDTDLLCSHSIDAAEDIHEIKMSVLKEERKRLHQHSHPHTTSSKSSAAKTTAIKGK